MLMRTHNYWPQQSLGRNPVRRGGRNVIRGILALVPVLAAGCAYDPPVAGDRRSAGFQADLAACRDVAEKNAYHAVIGRGPLFMTYPISYPLIKRREIRTCMVSKGHPLQEG